MAKHHLGPLGYRKLIFISIPLTPRGNFCLTNFELPPPSLFINRLLYHHPQRSFFSLHSLSNKTALPPILFLFNKRHLWPSQNTLSPCGPFHGIFAKEMLHPSRGQNSRLLSLPPRLLKLVISYLTDPLDLLRFSYTCHELFFLTALADWYSLVTYTYTNWVVSCGDTKDRDWKTMVLKDAALGVRPGSILPSLRTTSSPTTSTSWAVTSTALSSARSPVISKQTIASTAPADVTECTSSHPSKNRDAVDSQWIRMGTPIQSIFQDSHTSINSSMITHPKSVPSQSNDHNTKVAGECDRVDLTVWSSMKVSNLANTKLRCMAVWSSSTLRSILLSLRQLRQEALRN